MRPRGILAALALLPLASQAQTEMGRAELSAGIHRIEAEVANTYATRDEGLMHRRSLAPNQGMLLVFPQVERHCLWMRATLLPLSVAFLDEQGVIVDIADLEPLSEEYRCAARRARYALEMSRGWFARRGIEPGVAISGIESVPPAR